MREVFLATPKVRWSDIRGQHEVKKALDYAVEWPFKVRYDLHDLIQLISLTIVSNGNGPSRH